MKNLGVMMSVLSLVASLALAQVHQATGTITNDETQARLRISNCVFGGSYVDIFVNGEVAEINGVPQRFVPTLRTSGYQYLAPGTHSIAVTPTGMGLGEALMGPVDVTVEAGHRYTVVVLGQVDEADHQPLVIDETVAYQEIGAKPTDTAHITVNNVRGAAGIDFTLDGVAREEDVPYGGFQAAIWPSGPFTGLELAIHDAAGEVVVRDGFDGEGWNMPGMDFLDCVGGTPGTVREDWYNETSGQTSSLSAVDFLEQVGSADGSSPSFETFLSAVETAGLTETLASEDPYLLYVPTDEAFAALPQDQLSALLDDPRAMSELVRYHIVAGYYPPGNLIGPGVDSVVRTNLQGTDLVFRFDDTINGVAVRGLEHVMVRNGSRVITIAQVLLPPED